MNGEWEFYWKELLEPKDFQEHTLPEKTGYMKIPRPWNGFKVNGKELAEDGYASFFQWYCLRIPVRRRMLVYFIGFSVVLVVLRLVFHAAKH